jgi:mannosyltransferase
MSRRKGVGLALAAIVVVAALLRLVGLGAEPFWLDEAHTANFTTLTVAELWSFDDPFDTVNPPGFILAMKIWSQVSRSDEWLRLLPALAGIATIPVVHAIGARIGGRRVGLMAAGFMAVSGYHVRYSQEARAYALITLCAAVALWATTVILDDAVRGEPRHSSRPHRSWLPAVAYGVATGLSMHLHNTSVGIPLAANLAVGWWWLRHRPPGLFKAWTAANLVALAVWSPWLPGFVTQLGLVQANFWVPEPTVASVVRDLGVVFDAYAGLVVPQMAELWFHGVVLVAVAAVMWWGSAAAAPHHRLLLWAFVLVQPAFQLAFSLARPVFLSRTQLWILLGSAVMLALAANRGLTSPRRIGWKVAAAAVAGVVALGSAGYHLAFQKSAWDEAAAAVAAQASENDVILVLAGNTVVAFDRYFEGYGLDVERMRIPWDIPDRQSRGSVLSEDDLERILAVADRHDRVWLVLNSVGNIEGGELLAPALADRLDPVESLTFTEVGVQAFE